MTSSTASSRAPRVRLARLQAFGAATAVAAFVGVAVAAPLTTQQAIAVEPGFAERIHQQFVPELADDSAINVLVSPIEEIPKPEPEPEPETTSTQSATASAAVSAPPKYTGGGSPAEWMAAAGIPESEWGYVDSIVTRESGWNPNATNASSGACGLVQALPCTKVPGGNGYDPVANLAWGNGYANGRYGGWAQAYAFWQANHWW